MKLTIARVTLMITGILSIISAALYAVLAFLLFRAGWMVHTDPTFASDMASELGDSETSVLLLCILGFLVVVKLILVLMRGIVSLIAAKDASRWHGAWILSLVSLVLTTPSLILSVISGKASVASQVVSVAISAVTLWMASIIRKHADQ